MLPIRLPIRLARGAAPALRRAFSASPRAPTSTPHDPLHVSLPTDDLGLPTPQPPPITAFAPAPISPALLVRLHGLAALNPPASPEGLAADLGELVGLMDLVREVRVVPEEVEALLSAGEGFDAAAAGRGEAGLGEGEGRRVLEYATRRVGDFYGFKATRRGEDEG